MEGLQMLFTFKQWSLRAMPTYVADQGVALEIVSSPDDLAFLDWPDESPDEEGEQS
jgi:hypothetical protein